MKIPVVKHEHDGEKQHISLPAINGFYHNTLCGWIISDYKHRGGKWSHPLYLNPEEPICNDCLRKLEELRNYPI